jgi:hypothetical protein
MEQNHIPGLLIIAGTGRNSGKTTLACRIISDVKRHGVIAVKISPHQHDYLDGAEELHRAEGFTIHLETSPDGSKDTSRMLSAGAREAYYIWATDSTIEEAFRWLLDNQLKNKPVICESPSLRRSFTPSLFIITDSDEVHKRKDMAELTLLADIQFGTGSSYNKYFPPLFINGRWVLRS